MRAKLKDIVSIELACPLEEFWPADESNFALKIQLMIGADDSAGSESFELLVCTPDWIRTQYTDDGSVWGRHMLIVFQYDYAQIRSKIESYVRSVSGDDWTTLAQKLGRIAAWEIEDYRP